jgi:hypothetical protein
MNKEELTVIELRDEILGEESYYDICYRENFKTFDDVVEFLEKKVEDLPAEFFVWPSTVMTLAENMWFAYLKRLSLEESDIPW